MLRDNKNIYIRVLSWITWGAAFAVMHKMFTGVWFDIMHINKYFEIYGFGLYFKWLVKDIFPFWDAPINVPMDVEYYFFLLGFRIRDVLHVYLLFSAFKVIIMLAEMLLPSEKISEEWIVNYKKVKMVIEAYLVWMIWNLFAFIGFNSQYPDIRIMGIDIDLGYMPLLIFFAGVFALYYVKGWYNFHNDMCRTIWHQVRKIKRHL